MTGVASDDLSIAGRSLGAGEGEIGSSDAGPPVLVLDADRVTPEVHGFDEGRADAAHRVDDEIAGLAVGGDAELVSEEALKFAQRDQPPPAELDRAESPLVEQLMDRIVTDAEVLSGAPRRDRERDQDRCPFIPLDDVANQRHWVGGAA
jgi:hypothetical protein